MTEDDVRKFIASSTWTFAKTYADKSPHEYTVIKVNNPLRTDFMRFIGFIFDNGEEEKYFGHPFMVYRIDGRKYWSMVKDKNNIPDDEELINRSIEEQADIKYGDQV